MEPFTENPVDFAFFMSLFQESVEKKIHGSRGSIDTTHQVHHGTGIKADQLLYQIQKQFWIKESYDVTAERELCKGVSVDKTDHQYVCCTS